MLMKCLIKCISLLMMIYLQMEDLNATPVIIFHGHQEKQEAYWVKTILVRFGIPIDYIETSITHQGCSQILEIQQDEVLILCLDKSKKLEIVDFKRKDFFWQFGPLIRSH